MRHYKLRNPQQFDGGHTDLFILGLTHTAARGTDFTAAATQQTYNLLALNIGDIVFGPGIVVDVVTNLVGASISAATGSVGVTGALTQFINAQNLLAAGDEHYVPANSVAPYATIAADKFLTFDLNTTGANVSVITAAEFWIWVPISRKADRLTLRQA